MAFFEQLGKKLTDAGQGVAQQTRNMADIARLNNTISEKKKRMMADLTTLGEKYYAAHRDDPDAELSEFIAAIVALEAEIHQCEEEIKQIKGVTKCPGCGADVPLGAAFCSVCGRPAEQPAPVIPEGMRECPHCHKPVPAENKFCTGCGTKMED